MTSRRDRRARAARHSRRGRWRWFPTLVGLLVALVVLLSRGSGPPATIAGHPVASADVSHKQHTRTAGRTEPYTDPLRAVTALESGRIDMGADYGGSGPVVALGNGKVTVASDDDSGPPSCYGRTCWPVGGIVVYRLSDGPYTGKYVYVAENITVRVRVGQTVTTGQEIAIMHNAFPYVETGWASGNGPETLAIADDHQCPCGDPGGWSTIEGRDFAALLLALGAPRENLQPNVPAQHMPAGWPNWPSSAGFPRSRTPLPEGAATR